MHATIKIREFAEERKIMNATHACPRHFLPKKCLGRKNQPKPAGDQKLDNIVLIEVDSDDFGDVIILDVPESFPDKFRKKPKHVINIDDDDDNNSNDDNKSGACDPNGNATTSNRGSPTSAARSSDSADAAENSVGQGKAPIKLSKSKRTYSSKNVSQNRYGLSSDYICSSDSDYSDCEFMGDSSERRNDACFTPPHYSNCNSPKYERCTFRPSQPVQNSSEEVTAESSRFPGQQSNFSKCPLNSGTHDTFNDSAQKISKGSKYSQPDSGSTGRSGLSKRKRDGDGYSDSVDKIGSFVSDIHAFQSAKQSDANMSEPSSSSEPDDVAERSEAFIDTNSAKKDDPHPNVESSCPRSPEREQDPGKPAVSPDFNWLVIHGNEAKFAYDDTCLILDRQKRKETAEYKRAMEEEWSSRQKELQRQAEEAQRLRARKKADKMRIVANERRQMQRLEEVRETRRKDEENLNLKDKHRAEIKKDLSKLEKTCFDMPSLLRCLGIPVGGGQFPPPNEIQAAYKRACLKFHPDRFGRSDVKQQVEAEEKFKLISTMKDKFSLR